MSQQPMIDIYMGKDLVSTVPKANEQWIRKVYFGTPEERMLIIRPHGHKNPIVSQEIINKLVTTIQPEQTIPEQITQATAEKKKGGRPRGSKNKPKINEIR